MRTRTRIALVAAGLWSTALLVGAVTLPVYSGSTSGGGPDGSTVEGIGSATLVGVNGWGVLVVLAVPLLASLVVATLLVVRRRVGPGSAAAPGLLVAAWLAVALCGALAVLGLLSIGIFVLPVAMALAVAVATAAAPGVAKPAPEVVVGP